MRSFSVLLLLVLTAPAVGTEFPYTVYVTADDAFVRSGPGENYYPTARLDVGQKVEVYRHDLEGWYAIRPPSGSFTWIAADDVRRIGNGLGRVIGERVAVRTGSRLSDVRDVIQIRLEKDEIVEIIDTADVAGDRGGVGQTWYKIAPPSGEFRWISFRHVGRKPAREEIFQSPDYEVEEPREVVRTTSYREQEDESGLRWRRRGQTASQTAGRVQLKDRSKPLKKPRRLDSSVDESTEMLDSLEEQLSLMIADQPSQWRFDPIRRDIEPLADQVGSAVAQGRARRMLDRIDRFEEIRRRHQDVDAERAGTDWQNFRVADEDPLWSVAPIRQDVGRRLSTDYETDRGFESDRSAPRPTALLTGAATNFDGEGILRPVISRRRGAPRFALVNEQGAVLSFVTPARGVVLETLIGRTIGINGTRGFMPEYRRPHLVAEQVEVLGDGAERSVVASSSSSLSTSTSRRTDSPDRSRRY